MPRVEVLTGRRAPLLARALDFALRLAIGTSLAPLGVIAHNPRFLLPFSALNLLVHGGTQLGPELQTLATYLVAVRNGCSWCIDFGRFAAARDRADLAKLDRVVDFATDPRFTKKERVALAFVDAILETRGHPDDEVFAVARAELSEREIVELAVATATENLFNWVNGSLEIEEQGFCALAPAVGAARGAAA